MIGMLAGQFEAVNAKLKAIEARLVAWHRQDQTSQCLATIPGIGPIGSVSFALKVTDPRSFRSGRHFAAWTGITPRENATGGTPRPGRISRQGDESLRRLLVLGATAVIQQAKKGHASPWLLALLARKPKKLAAVTTYAPSPNSARRSFTTWSRVRVCQRRRRPIGAFSISAATFSATNTGPGLPRRSGRWAEKCSSSSNAKVRG